MGLDQLQMVPLVPDDSLLHLLTTQGQSFCNPTGNIFYLG